MFKYVLPAGDNNLGQSERIRRQLALIARDELLADRLRMLDSVRANRRIYIMGCGRSGTWLLTSLMSTFGNLCLLPKELQVEYFGLVAATEDTLVLKRHFRAHETVERIPDAIGILYIIRHPFDVLTSFNPAEPTPSGKYYITPARWLSEMQALQYLVDTKRPNTLIVRYEDLVSDPQRVQSQIAEFFKLEIAVAPDEIPDVFKPPPEAISAMHGVREIDRNSLHKFRNSREKIIYLGHIRPRLGRLLDWVSESFEYDIGLPR